ncbi:MAG: carboxyl transferase domain-containing protein, partial [Candidatus Heimdallarchaeaceae archaeon]
IAVMGAEGACNIIYRKELKKAENPEQALQDFVAKYKKQFSNPIRAAEKGYVDKVILPEETRIELSNALKFLQNKRIDIPKRKHGNIPL